MSSTHDETPGQSHDRAEQVDTAAIRRGHRVTDTGADGRRWCSCGGVHPCEVTALCDDLDNLRAEARMVCASLDAAEAHQARFAAIRHRVEVLYPGFRVQPIEPR